MKLIKKENIKSWLYEMEKDREVWAPVTVPGGDVLFSRLDEGEICYELKPMMSCRRILFPQEESMFKVKSDGSIEETLDTTKRVLFGIRSCDASAIAFLDRFFSKNFTDPYYFSRRKNALIITLGCNKPMDTCWCVDLETGPFLDKNFDLQLYEISETEFLIEEGSQEGKTVLEKYASFFEDSPQDAMAKIAVLKEESRKQFNKEIDFKKALFLIANGKVPKEVYEEYSKECLECGACAFVCPTCTCFDVREIKEDGCVTKCRLWENCFFRGFTKEASGHNPRSIKRDRIARRFEHKFVFEKINDDMIGCTGCGRCTNYCITKIGVHRFAELATK